MTELHSQNKTRTSLRVQYIAAAIVVVSLFAIGAIVASLYFKYATEKNTALLKLHDIIIVNVDELRNSIWRADKSLYILLSDSENVQEDKIKSHFDEINVILKNFSEIEGLGKLGILKHINSMTSNQEKLNSTVNQLLQLRKDVNWLNPILPLINTTLHESNNKFETALNQALTESTDSIKGKYAADVSRLLNDLRDIWRLKRIDFRGALIRYAGLKTKNNSQEKNIKDYNLLIEQKIQKLDAIAKRVVWVL